MSTQRVHQQPEQQGTEKPASGRKSELSGAKVFRYFPQDEVGYVNLHTNPAQACANCRFFKVDWDGEQYLKTRGIIIF